MNIRPGFVAALLLPLAFLLASTSLWVLFTDGVEASLQYSSIAGCVALAAQRVVDEFCRRCNVEIDELKRRSAPATETQE